MTRDPMMSETLAETLYGHGRSARAAVPPRRRRLAGLTAGALALSVVFAQATPVRADDTDDLVAALAALALLGVIINETNDDRPAPPPPPPPPHPYPVYPQPAQGVMLPAVCAIQIEGRDHRELVFYGERCLDRAGIDHLPQRCAREISYQGNRDWVYGQACLREAGYRFQPPLRRDYERPD